MTSYPVKAIKVSHDVIETLVDRGTIGVTEVATALDIPKSTAYDHLRTLEQVGYVVNEDGTYRLSTQFLHIGEVARNNHELFVRGRDETLELVEATDQKAHVQLVTEESRRCAALIATRWQRETLQPQATQTYPTRIQLHTNAPGKAILAHKDDETVERILSEDELQGRTPNTITDEAELWADLDRIRDDGYAVDDGELITGMAGIAAPIVTEDEVRGSIAIYCASDRFETDLRESKFVDMVREAAREIRANFIFT